MRRALLSLLSVPLLLGACAHGGPQPFVPDTALVAPGQLGFGVLDADVQAVNYAAWAFADPGRTRNNPAAAARACASMDYIAGQLYTSPRWANIGAITKEQLLRGRVEMRRALGIPVDARSQLVVVGLADASKALTVGNQQAALAALSNPAFPDPQATLARLYSLPYLQQANIGSLKASNELFGPGNSVFVP
jgi:hypothetical protein